MITPGDIISYLQMCQEENASLQRGMNYRLGGGNSVILMSLRKGAPYSDRIEDDGKVLIYEGHDISKKQNGPNPKNIDQPYKNPSGTLTQNGLFFEAAKRFKDNKGRAEVVRVYEKIRNGIWAYNGYFRLTDAWQESYHNRTVFKYKLESRNEIIISKNHPKKPINDIEHNRIIPTSIKLAVWKRDKGCCTKCGNNDNLHFDHIIPYSKGGSSLMPENIQLLCVRHNLEKRDRIE